MNKNHCTVPSQVIGEIIGLILALGFSIYLAPTLPFVTSTYQLWLPIGIASAIISAVSRIVGHVMYIWPVKPLSQIIAHAVTLYSIWQLKTIFPFDFGLVGYDQLNSILQFTLLVALFGTAVAALVNFIKLITLHK
ncbi:hypothetical protein GYA49_03205 [Candidatus Beckwithbacteria bacterium]|nr:hypothetical protein [Candidatus Beckwithbacteria bacterium]